MFRFTIYSIISLSFINVVSTRLYQCDRSAECGCSSESLANITARIVGGEIVQKRTWGWMVSLQKYNTHFCGASLISAEYAITAAHCVSNSVYAPGSLSILAGVNILSQSSSSKAQRRNLLSIDIHPAYDERNFLNDIAIIRFAPLTTTSQAEISFVCLPESFQDPFSTGNDLVATGWGYTYQGSGVASNVLQQVTLQAVASSSSACIAVGIQNPTIRLCAGLVQGGKDTCQGDSGGPLLAFKDNRWILIGITSSGIGCALPNSPGLYTRVSAYIGYIKSVTGLSFTTTATTRITESMESDATIFASNSCAHSMNLVILSLFLYFSFN